MSGVFALAFSFLLLVMQRCQRTLDLDDGFILESSPSLAPRTHAVLIFPVAPPWPRPPGSEALSSALGAFLPARHTYAQGRPSIRGLR